MHKEENDISASSAYIIVMIQNSCSFVFDVLRMHDSYLNFYICITIFDNKYIILNFYRATLLQHHMSRKPYFYIDRSSC